MSTEPAKDKILRVSGDLILGKGFPATTVDEICEAAKTSKGSFYHSFKSKEDLGLELLDQFWVNAKQVLGSGEFWQETDSKRRLEGFFQHLEASSEHLWGKGCLLGTFAMDMAETSPKTQRRVSDILSQMTSVMAPVFACLEESEQIDMTMEDAAVQFIAVIEGSILVARSHKDPSYIIRGIRNYRNLVMPLVA